MPERWYTPAICSAIMLFCMIGLVVSVRRMVRKYSISDLTAEGVMGTLPPKVSGSEYLRRVQQVRKAEAQVTGNPDGRNSIKGTSTSSP